MHPIRKDRSKRLFVTVKQTGGSGTRNVLQEQHGVALEQQGKATVLALKRRAHLHGAVFVAENTGTLAVDMDPLAAVILLTFCQSSRPFVITLDDYTISTSSGVEPF